MEDINRSPVEFSVGRPSVDLGQGKIEEALAEKKEDLREGETTREAESCSSQVPLSVTTEVSYDLFGITGCQ